MSKGVSPEKLAALVQSLPNPWFGGPKAYIPVLPFERLTPQHQILDAENPEWVRRRHRRHLRERCGGLGLSLLP